MTNLNSSISLPSLIIVDDDPLIRDSLRLALADKFDIVLAENRIQAINLLREMPEPPQLALVDLGLPPTPHRPDRRLSPDYRIAGTLSDHKIIVLSGQR